MTRRQHHKGRKRPRAWHRGAGVGRAWIRAVRKVGMDGTR